MSPLPFGMRNRTSVLLIAFLGSCVATTSAPNRVESPGPDSDREGDSDERAHHVAATGEADDAPVLPDEEGLISRSESDRSDGGAALSQDAPPANGDVVDTAPNVDETCDGRLECGIYRRVRRAIQAADEGEPVSMTLRVQSTFGGWGGDATPSYAHARLDSASVRESYVIFEGEDVPPQAAGFGLFEVHGHYTGQWGVIRGQLGRAYFYPIFAVDSWCYAGRPRRGVRGKTASADMEELFYAPGPGIARCR